MIFLSYWILKHFKKLRESKYFIIYKEKSILGLNIYGILRSNDKILTTKDIPDYSKIRIVKYFKYKNYYIV